VKFEFVSFYYKKIESNIKVFLEILENQTEKSFPRYRKYKLSSRAGGVV
jgi:hypothetical protein